MSDDINIVFIDMTEKQEDLPECNNDPCPKCGSASEIGFGLAGGGYGPYSYCPKCDLVLSKSEDNT